MDLLPEWRLGFDIIDLQPRAISREAQGPLLQTILTKLQLMQTAPGVPVRLTGWAWTEAMALAVREAVPTLGHLALGVHVAVLTGKALGILLQMGKWQLGRLYAGGSLHAARYSWLT